MKDFERVAQQTYLNISDIQTLLGVSWKKAKHAYQLASEIDDGMAWRIEPHKVRMQSVLKVTGISLNMLMKQKGLK